MSRIDSGCSPARATRWFFQCLLVIAVLCGATSWATDPLRSPKSTAQSAANDVRATLLRELSAEKKWKELADQFKDEDFSSWPRPADAFSLRGQAFARFQENARAEQDLKRAAELAPKVGDHWFNLAEFYRNSLKDDAQALSAYHKAFECAGKSLGWLPISATLNEAALILKQGNHRGAKQVMERYDDSDLLAMAPVWGDKMRSLNEQIASKAVGSLLVIADKGQTDYQIVMPDKYPTPAIEADLKQVARLVQVAFKANGADLPIVTESARNAAKPAIFLGDTAFARSKSVAMTQIKGWSYVHKAVGKDVIVAGLDQPGPGRATNLPGAGFDRIGTAKAAVDFLQKYVGTRFLYPEKGGFGALSNVASVDLLNSPTIEYLATPTIAVPPDLDVTKTPTLEYDITWPPTTSFYHFAQNRFPNIDSTFGGHTWHRAVPCNEAAFAANPERFALLGGKRMLTGGDAQIQFCISNPDVQELLYKDLEKHFAMGFQNVDIGQPDGFRGCECEACTKLFDTGTDWNEKVWILHRNLAERAHKGFPDRTVTLSVYAVTEVMPKTFKSFPPNVRLGMSGTRDHELAAWRNFGVPQGFATYLYYWCPNLMPRYFPMRTPLYVENAAKRLMAANVHSIARDGNGGIAFGLEGPTYYTMGRMFDGPGEHTAKSLVVEFVNASFGKSAPAMLGFYDQIFNSVELYARYMATREDGWAFKDMYGRSRKHLSQPESVIAFLYPVDLVQSLEKQLALAEKTDLGPKVQTRLALVRREFEYLKGVVNTVHLYNAHQISPDPASLDRLLNAIDARRVAIDQLFAKGNELKGWPLVMFPPTGHNPAALKLEYDGYQEPFKSSFFNWDTAAKRNAPLANAKRILCGSATGPVKIDSPFWSSIQTQTLIPTKPSNANPLSSEVRAAFDKRNLYLRFESALSPGATLEMVEKERVEAFLMPAAGTPVTYRFAAGLKPDSRTQAARGLIEDLLNLAYGKFDPLWQCDWTHSAVHDPKANRLTVLMTIPLTSIPPAKTGATWYVNFQRLSPTSAAPNDAYAWSVIAGGSGIDDPRSNGEMSFAGAGASASLSPLQMYREKNYKETFEVPAQWKDQIATGPQIALNDWRFRADQTDAGVTEEWFKSARYSEAEWIPVKVPAFWGENDAIGNLEGHGWYRVTFTLPPSCQGKPLRLMFAGVDEEAWLYLNGKQVGEHSVKSEKKPFTALYDEPFTIDVAAADLKNEQPNVLFVRVHNQVKAGGIWKPVFAIGLPVK
ncbi:MAG: DUF4838 domain-containing protein [Planctomycetia bacterium]|nr:DUF4838 domain-containing protein [Planctomycetia bacterium]